MEKATYKKIFAAAALATLIAIFLPVTGPSIELKSAPSPILSSSQRSSLVLFFSPKINFAEASDSTTQAQQSLASDPFSCSLISNGVATCAMYLAAMAVVWVLKLFISVGALLVQIGLQVNQHLYDAPIVTIGFSVSLAIANLGFVLGIIIIALATILRNPTYGAKQILWKLVVMAIFINFGLVITRPIVAVADGITSYFMGQISGASGDATAFTGNLVNAFAPNVLSEPTIVNPQDLAKDAACDGVGAATGGGGYIACQIVGSVVKFFATNESEIFVRVFLSCIFAIALAAIIAFTLIILSILLLVRYVYLCILLVLLPFAWLMWVFPKFSGEFSKWWNNFIKWAFFPTCALFFIYITLATITSTAYQNSALQVADATKTASQQAMGGIFTMTGLIEMIQQFANEVVLAALMIGGLFASQALTGKAGGMVVQGGKSAAGWVGSKAGGAAARQGKKVAARAVSEDLRNKLQSGQLGGIGKIVPKRLQVAAGIGLANVQKAGGSSLVTQESAWAKEQGKDVDSAARLLRSGGLSEAKQFALLGALRDSKKFDPTKVTHVGAQDINTFVADDTRFKRYGQAPLQSDLQNAMKPGGKTAIQAANVVAAQGTDAKMKDNENLMGQGAGADVNAMDLLRKALDKNTASLDKDALKKQNLSYMFGRGLKNPDGSENKQQVLLLREYLKAMMRNKPQLIQNMMPRLSQDGLDKLEKLFRQGIVENAQEIRDSSRPADEKAQLGNRLLEISEAFKKAMARNIMGLIPDESEEVKKPEEPEAPGGGDKK